MVCVSAESSPPKPYKIRNVLAAAIAGSATFVSSAATAQELDPYARIGVALVEADFAVFDDDEQLEASSRALRTEAGVEYDLGNSSVFFEVDADYVDFDNPDFTDRWRYRAATWWEGDVGDDFELRVRGDVATGIPGAEYFNIDELEVGTRLEYEPVRAHRARVDLRWRERRYDDPSAGDPTGSGPEIRGEYRYRFGRYHYLEAEARYEEIDATDPFRNYSRWHAIASYTQPITDELRVRPSVEYRETDFSGRLLPDGDFRRDEQWTPEVELFWWPDDWRFQAGAAYISRNSTELDEDRDGWRLDVSAAYVF